MSDQSVDASASTSNTRKKLTDEERKERRRERDRKAYAANKEKVLARNKKWYEANKEKRAICQKKWAEKNREHIAAYRSTHRERDLKRYREYNATHKDQRKKWRKKHATKIAAQVKEYAESHPQQTKQAMAKYLAKEDTQLKRTVYMRKRRQEDVSFRLLSNLRTRLHGALKGKYKSGSAVRDMGCTGQEACDHLESLFDKHMTWDNWGTYWDVDHIYPLAAATLEDRIEFLAVNNWRNLQPLEQGENARKGDTVTPEAQKLFDDLKTQFRKENAA